MRRLQSTSPSQQSYKNHKGEEDLHESGGLSSRQRLKQRKDKLNLPSLKRLLRQQLQLLASSTGESEAENHQRGTDSKKREKREFMNMTSGFFRRTRHQEP